MQSVLHLSLCGVFRSYIIHVILSFVQVQINNNIKHDTFTELPVSLVFFSLICIDVVERIRHCRLTGQGELNYQHDLFYSTQLQELQEFGKNSEHDLLRTL